MATLNYRIKETKKNPTVIYARFKHSKEYDFEIPTGFEVDKKRWSNPKQLVNLSEETKDTYDAINNKLREFKNHILLEFNTAQANGTSISKSWMQTCLQKFFDRDSKNKESDKSLYFTDFIDWFIEISQIELNPKTREKRKYRTVQDYRTTLKRIKHFEETKKHKFKLSEISRDYYLEFMKYCEDVHKLNQRTIGGSINLIKSFLKRAEIEGYKVNMDFKKGVFVSPDNETYDFALSVEDIEKITTHDFSDNDRLDNARDWLVIGIWTGLRVSDLLKLDKSKIQGDFFELKNKKTGIFVVIPIHEDVQKILEKHNGFPRKISDQKFNDYIKEVAQESGLTEMTKGAKMVETEVAGFSKTPTTEFRKKVGYFPKDELITSHICRRTFATIHYGKLDTLSIMKIIGHSTEKQFLEYVKITPREHAEKMKEFWNKINKS